MHRRLVAMAIIAALSSCSRMDRPLRPVRLVSPSLVLSEMDVGHHEVPSTTRREALSVDVSRNLANTDEPYSMFIRTSDGRIGVRVPIGSWGDQFHAEFIDLTGDGVEELLLSSVIAHGSENTRVDELFVYSLVAGTLLPLGSTGYRETADDTEWKYAVTYPMEVDRGCPSIRFVMKTLQDGQEIASTDSSNIGPIIKELSFCQTAKR